MGKIIFNGKTNGGVVFSIRYPREDDASLMCDYINILSKEKTFIRFQGEKISFEEEKKYLNQQIKNILEKKAVMLFVIVENKIIGIANLCTNERVENHVGAVGISVLNEYRNKGIGATLMKLMLEEAQKNISHLKIVTLGVFSNNQVAIDLYKKFGFKEYGNLPEGIFYQDTYVDHVLMYLRV